MVIGIRESTVCSVPDSTDGLRQRSNKTGVNRVGFCYPCVLFETINVSLEIQNLVNIDPFNPDLSRRTRFIVFLPRTYTHAVAVIVESPTGPWLGGGR